MSQAVTSQQASRMILRGVIGHWSLTRCATFLRGPDGVMRQWLGCRRSQRGTAAPPMIENPGEQTETH